jgi:uncharacterized alpha-E superfamily protein
LNNPLLARYAECIFWLARFVERAENLARVTSLNRAEAANFGRDEHIGHDGRYDRADEFMEVVLGH